MFSDRLEVYVVFLGELSKLQELSESLETEDSLALWAQKCFGIGLQDATTLQSKIFELGEIEAKDNEGYFSLHLTCATEGADEMLEGLCQEMLACGYVLSAVLQERFPDIAMNFHGYDVKGYFGAHTSTGDLIPEFDSCLYSSGCAEPWDSENVAIGDLNTNIDAWCEISGLAREGKSQEQMLELIANYDDSKLPKDAQLRLCYFEELAPFAPEIQGGLITNLVL